MKNLKKMMMTCLVAGTLAACSSTRTANSGTGETDSGNMGTGSDRGTSMDTVTSGNRQDTMSNSASGSGTNVTGSVGIESGTDNPNTSDNLNQNNVMSGTQGAMTMASDSSSAQMFLPQAAQASMRDVEISRLAMEKSKNPAIRKFASMMIRNHSQNNQRLMSMGAKKNISMPNMMAGMGSETTGAIGTVTSDDKRIDNTMPDNTNVNPNNQTAITNTALSSDLSTFQNLNGAEFDTRYMQQMVQDHEQAIALYTSASQSDDTQVKAHAKKTLPTLRSHLTKARDILDKMN